MSPPSSSSISHKAEWKLKNKLINTIISNDGEIFGGAVRDKYLHDDHSMKFYKTVMDIFKDNEARGIDKRINIDKMYNDKEYLPELFGRWIVPDDIDACICESKEENLIARITEQFGEIKKVFSRDPKDYFPTLGISENQLRHDRYLIYPVNRANIRRAIFNVTTVLSDELVSECQQFRSQLNIFLKKIGNVRPIVLDLMVYLIPTYLIHCEVPFGNIDFECNGLIMNKTGIRISKNLYENYLPNIFENNPVMRTTILVKILNDIINHTAVFCYKPEFPWYRCMKMGDKGWKIEGLFNQIEIIDDENYTGHCIICHQDLPKYMLKLKCCDARYHTLCMQSAFHEGVSSIMNTSKCIMCKKSHTQDILRQDHDMLQLYIEHAPYLSWWPSSHLHEEEQQEQQNTIANQDTEHIAANQDTNADAQHVGDIPLIE